MKIVFDTYAWIEYFKGSEQGKIVNQYIKEKIITPLIVLLELSYRANKEGWDIIRYLNFIRFHSEISVFNENFIIEFGKNYNKLKKEIQDFSMADCIILTTAKLENAKVLTGDVHFKNFSETIFLD